MKVLLVLSTLLTCSITITSCGSSAQSSTGKMLVVGAENFYGDLLGQIGGNRVDAVSILSDPNADPHAFESSARDATTIARASLVVENGVGYDAWMDHLLSATQSGNRTTVVVGDLTGHHAGDNPHLWYDVAAMEKLSRVLATDLTKLDPSGKSYYVSRQKQFVSSLRPVLREIDIIHSRHAGETVAQTEPVFGYMLSALGLQAQEGPFQRAVENGTDPSPRAVIDFQSLLQHGGARALLYNLQTVEPVTQHMKSVAAATHVPIIGVTETEPKATTYQAWMLSELRELQHALDGAR